MSMAKPKMAPPKSKPLKGTPPSDNAETNVVGNNISKPAAREYRPLNFKVDAEFCREFKTFAASNDMKLNELLRQAFELYREHKSGKIISK
ncbi:MAG: hypothetical protein ACRCWB_09585 [Enterovibrio sp.]